MADEGPVQNLCEETTCSICLEYFKDPVIIDCGHIFCQACITHAWGKSDGDPLCPQCREPCQQRNIRPIRQLASIVEIAKKFSLQMAKGAEALGRVCERHQEPLKLFCEDDQAPICVVCDKSKEHREHKVIPKEEAFEEYQGKILNHLEFLNKQREEILSSKLKGETESLNLLKQTDMERQKIMADFQQLHQFLEEQERLLMAQLKELDDEIKSCEDQRIAKLSEEMSSIEDLIKELEEKQKQPATEFLQNMRSILERCNENENQTVDAIAFPHELKKQIDGFSKMHPFLEKKTKKFKEIVLSGPQEDSRKPNLPSQGEDKAFPELVLSAYGQAQGNYYGQPQYNSGFSVNINCYSYVMGVERITSGTHSWIVNVGNENFWAVGVVKESLRGCNIVNLNDSIGIWAIGRFYNGAYYASTHPGISLRQSLSPMKQRRITFNTCWNNCTGQKEPKRVRVLVNYESGLVTFCDADSNTNFFSFSASFSGEKICSFLCVAR